MDPSKEERSRKGSARSALRAGGCGAELSSGAKFLLEPLASLHLVVLELRAVERVGTQPQNLLQQGPSFRPASHGHVVICEIQHSERVVRVTLQAVLKQFNRALLVATLEKRRPVENPRQSALSRVRFVTGIKTDHRLHLTADGVKEAQPFDPACGFRHQAVIGAHPEVPFNPIRLERHGAPRRLRARAVNACCRPVVLRLSSQEILKSRQAPPRLVITRIVIRGPSKQVDTLLNVRQSLAPKIAVVSHEHLVGKALDPAWKRSGSPLAGNHRDQRERAGSPEEETFGIKKGKCDTHRTREIPGPVEVSENRLTPPAPE